MFPDKSLKINTNNYRKHKLKKISLVQVFAEKKSQLPAYYTEMALVRTKEK